MKQGPSDTKKAVTHFSFMPESRSESGIEVVRYYALMIIIHSQAMRKFYPQNADTKMAPIFKNIYTNKYLDKKMRTCGKKRVKCSTYIPTKLNSSMNL